MRRGEFPDAAAATPADLRARYESRLAAVVEAVGPEAAADRTDIDADILRDLLDGAAPELTLAEAAEILALEDGAPEAP
ncbi:MAG: DUF5791 family protein, partial [Candidatus Nanohaloarchaea archaeon]